MKNIKLENIIREEVANYNFEELDRAYTDSWNGEYELETAEEALKFLQEERYLNMTVSDVVTRAEKELGIELRIKTAPKSYDLPEGYVVWKYGFEDKGFYAVGIPASVITDIEEEIKRQYNEYKGGNNNE